MKCWKGYNPAIILSFCPWVQGTLRVLEIAWMMSLPSSFGTVVLQHISSFWVKIDKDPSINDSSKKEKKDWKTALQIRIGTRSFSPVLLPFELSQFLHFWHSTAKKSGKTKNFSKEWTKVLKNAKNKFMGRSLPIAEGMNHPCSQCLLLSCFSFGSIALWKIKWRFSTISASFSPLPFFWHFSVTEQLLYCVLLILFYCSKKVYFVQDNAKNQCKALRR